MDYVITFSDVMAALIALGGTVLTFFIKSWFTNLNQTIKENDKKINERVDKLEQRTDIEIEELKKELKSIEKDFPIVYVQRDDFFRSMNSVEGNMKDISAKIDKLLLQNSSK